MPLDHLHPHQPLRQAQSGLQRIGQAPGDSCLDHQPVDHHLDGVFLLLVQLRRLGQLVHRAVDAHPDETVGLQLLQFLAVFPFAAADHRRQEQQAGLLRQGHDPVDHLLHRLRGDLLAA